MLYGGSESYAILILEQPMTRPWQVNPSSLGSWNAVEIWPTRNTPLQAWQKTSQIQIYDRSINQPLIFIWIEEKRYDTETNCTLMERICLVQMEYILFELNYVVSWFHWLLRPRNWSRFSLKKFFKLIGSLPVTLWTSDVVWLKWLSLASSK